MFDRSGVYWGNLRNFLREMQQGKTGCRMKQALREFAGKRKFWQIDGSFFMILPEGMDL